MLWQCDILQEDWDRLKAKAQTDKTTVAAMLTTKIDQYLADVRRETGADVDAEIQKRLATKSLAERTRILATL